MVHRGIEGIANHRYNRDRDDRNQKNEPGGAPPQGIRWLGDSEGVDEGGREHFKKPHAVIIRKNALKGCDVPRLAASNGCLSRAGIMLAAYAIRA